MAKRGLFSTTKLIPLLNENVVHLSAIQIYRLAAEKPKRLNLRVLGALMDTLDCTADGLIRKVACLRRRAPPRGLAEELRRRGQKTGLAGGVRQQPRNPLPVPLVRELTNGRCILAMRGP